jgi:DNA topoisomerase-1
MNKRSNNEYSIPDVETIDTAEEAARRAGLRYVSDEEPGYRRRRQGRGFAYLDVEGNYVKDEGLRERFDNLIIPPAWTDVWICADEKGHIQATGRDDAGRKQYIYHPHWEEVRNEAKFNRLIPFADVLPQIRAQVDQDMRRRGMPRQKVLAIVVRLLEETRIRIGNLEYARRNGSYGLTTMENEHIEINGSRLHFSFTGKSGIEHSVDLYDRRLARHLKLCQEFPGQELFQYLDEEGNRRAIDSGDVNDYLREITGQNFTAKDFRTWAGTVLALDELYERGEAEDEKRAERQIVDAVKAVAEGLGNTPQVCRAYYIHPAILDAYRTGDLFVAVSAAAAHAATEDEHALSPDEEAVLALICERVEAS